MLLYKEVLKIEKEYIESSLLTHHEFKLLFTDIFGFDFNPVDASAIDEDLFQQLLCKLNKRKSGEPIQYILGKWPFNNLELYVDNRALIPRPETEYLAQYAENLAKQIEDPIIVDLCSGCGAIALYLKHNITGSSVSAVELSHSACDLINKNKENLKLEINIIEKDVIEYLCSLPNNSIDFFVSNPPYVKESDYYSNYEELKHEPLIAFVAAEDGLSFYNHMTELCYEKLKHNGYILYEIGEEQGQEVKNILLSCGYQDVIIKKDFNFLDRYVIGKK